MIRVILIKGRLSIYHLCLLDAFLDKKCLKADTDRKCLEADIDRECLEADLKVSLTSPSLTLVPLTQTTLGKKRA